MRDESIQDAYLRFEHEGPTRDQSGLRGSEHTHPAGIPARGEAASTRGSVASVDVLDSLEAAGEGADHARMQDWRANERPDVDFARGEARLAWARVRGLEDALETERLTHRATQEALRCERQRGEDAAVIRRGLTDDLRAWRRRALEAEANLRELRLRSVASEDESDEADDDAVWREAAALALRVAEVESARAELAEERDALREERDRLEEALAVVSELVDLAAPDLWQEAAAARARLAEQRAADAEELRAARAVNESLVRERDAAHRACAQARRTLRRHRARRRQRVERHRGVTSRDGSSAR